MGKITNESIVTNQANLKIADVEILEKLLQAKEENKQTDLGITLAEFWELLCKLKGYKPDDFQRYSQIYVDVTQSARFVYDGNTEQFFLKEFHQDLYGKRVYNYHISDDVKLTTKLYFYIDENDVKEEPIIEEVPDDEDFDLIDDDNDAIKVTSVGTTIIEDDEIDDDITEIETDAWEEGDEDVEEDVYDDEDDSFGKRRK